MKLSPTHGRRRSHTLRRSLIPLFCLTAQLGLTAASSGATYTFEDLTALDSLSTAPGWTPSQPDNFPNAPIAWATTWDRPGIGPSTAGALGGIFDTPATSSYTIGYSTPLSLSNTSVPSTVSFDMSIFDSTTGFPGRDSFGFSVNDALGAAFFTAEFRPVAQSGTPDSPTDPTASWEVRYTVRGSGSVSTMVGLMESEAYTMEVSFTGTGLNFAFDVAGAATLANSFAGVPFGYDISTESIGSISFNWTKTPLNSDFGNNFMVVDNITAVPEPGAVSLAAAAFALPLFIRRRQRKA